MLWCIGRATWRVPRALAAVGAGLGTTVLRERDEPLSLSHVGGSPTAGTAEGTGRGRRKEPNKTSQGMGSGGGYL